MLLSSPYDLGSRNDKALDCWPVKGRWVRPSHAARLRAAREKAMHVTKPLPLPREVKQ